MGDRKQRSREPQRLPRGGSRGRWRWVLAQVGVGCTLAWFCCCGQSEGTAQLGQDAGQVRAVVRQGPSESGSQVRVPLVWVTTEQGARKDIFRGRPGSAKPFQHSSEAVSLAT